MLCLVTDLHCDPEGQASALAAWPKPLRQLGGKQDANSHPTLRGEEAAASLEDRDQPDYAAWEIGECGGGGVTGAYSSPLRPVNQGTTSQTRSGGGVERNSCQETSGDTATAAVWPWLWRSTRGAYELLPRLHPWPPAPKPPPPTPPGQKVVLLHVPWACDSTFSLIWFAQLNFRGHPATSLCKGHDPGGQRLSLALVKQGLH